MSRRDIRVLMHHGCCNGMHDDIQGGGWLSNLAGKVSNIVTSPFRTIKGRLTKNSQSIMDQYGGVRILKLQVFRQPLSSVLTGALKVVSLGTFKPDQSQLYHLGLWLSLDNGVNIVMEKNDAPDFYVSQYAPKNAELKAVPLPGLITLNEFYEKGLNYMGPDRFFIYTGLQNNCQNWVKGMLEPWGIYTPDVNGFVMQDMTNVRNNMPGYVEKTMNTLTDVGNIARKWLGQGKVDEEDDLMLF
jgi:hypothetical protein